MNLTVLDQIVQYVAWVTALVELILGLYILLLNPRHQANRFSSIVLLLISANSFAVGWLVSANTAGQALLPALLLAATTPSIQSVLLIASVAILRPDWLRGSTSFVWKIIGLLALLPAAATLIDFLTGTSLWYTGLPAAYSGGFVNLVSFTNGVLGSIIRLTGFSIASGLVLLLLFYLSFFDRSLTRNNRLLARLLLLADTLASLSIVLLSPRMPAAVAIIIPSLMFALAYAFAGFQQMISERRLQRGSLQLRLTALILVVTIPLLVAVSIFVVNRAGALLERSALETLRANNRASASSIAEWLDSNRSALQLIAAQPDITSMDPARQSAVVKTLVNSYPYMYLVSTTGLDGVNLARSDDADLADYSDRIWFQRIRDGAPVAIQTLVGRPSGSPALVMAVPILNTGRLTGVMMFAVNLDRLASLVQTGVSGGATLLINEENQLIGHSDPSLAADLKIWGLTNLWVPCVPARLSLLLRSANLISSRKLTCRSWMMPVSSGGRMPFRWRTDGLSPRRSLKHSFYPMLSSSGGLPF